MSNKSTNRTVDNENFEQTFIARLGRSKMEKLQDLFTMTDKETGMSVFRTVGGSAFFMWWYIEGRCYGKQKVVTFPKMETLVKEIGKSETTIRGWLRKLEKAGAIKRVPVYLKETGAQTSNLILVNAEFPNIPEGWNDVYKYGAIKDGRRFYPKNPDNDARQKIAGDLNQELIESDEPETASDEPGKKLPGSNKGTAKNDRPPRQKNAAPPNSKNPVITRDQEQSCEREEDNHGGENMDEWMGAPRLPIEDVRKTIDQENENDPILEAIYEGVKWVDITGDGNEKVDRAEFAGEFYMILCKYFRNRMDPEIVRIAFRLYNDKQYSMDGRKTVEYIENPAGWFYSCYQDAISIYKQIRYVKTAEEREQREKELVKKTILVARM